MEEIIIFIEFYINAIFKKRIDKIPIYFKFFEMEKNI